MKNLDHLSSLVLISGISGAGKSTASNVLSDLGFYTTDNLPVELLPRFLEMSKKSEEKFAKTCLLLDIDSSENVKKLLEILPDREDWPDRLRLIFLECETGTVIKRYSETRRPHPGFNPKRDKTLKDAIQRERGRLLPIKEIADFVLDSSEFTVHDLKRELKGVVDSFAGDVEKLVRVNFLSFGFKYGIPLDCDMVVDVRFLPNPHFVDHLREKTGLDPEVSEYVLENAKAQEFITRFYSFLTFLLPQYAYEGKSYLNIGVGCTGGKHRSVAIAEHLSQRVDTDLYVVSARHRDRTRG